MAKRRNYRNRKKYSYRERQVYHTARMRQGFKRDDKLTKSESYSAGYVNWDSPTALINSVLLRCDKEAFEAGLKAGSNAYNKAVDHKF